LSFEYGCGATLSLRRLALVLLSTALRRTDRMSDEARGFALIDKASRSAMGRKGGRAAHQRGTAHRWTPEEAREAGRKGGGVLLRSGDTGPTDRLRSAADALGGIADTLEHIAGEPGAATTGGMRAMRESIAHVSDAVDRIENSRRITQHVPERRSIRP
jgi:general stress protein YciG